MNYEEARIRAETLKALANPIRILLVNELASGDKCVRELAKVAGVDLSNISRHLAILKRAGIVSERRDGLLVINHLETPCILKAFDCAVEVLKSQAQRNRRILKL